MLLKGSFLFVLLGIFSCQNAEELKREQYFAEGFQLYTANCANCHQADGKGMASLYPPLNVSSALQDKGLLSCVIKNGMRDTILVQGKKFSRPMPANPRLTDLEIAEIITFVKVKWAGDSVYTHTDLVTKSLAECEKIRVP
jgi:mono/diheme cytochrome c family protein